MKYEEVLKEYNYADPQQVSDAVEKLRDTNSLEALYMIVLWKTNRLIPADRLKEIQQKIRNLSIKSIKSIKDQNEVRGLLSYMLETPGIRLPMASAILHFYYPDVFPIIDQRAYRAAYLEDSFFDQEFDQERYEKAVKETYPCNISDKKAPDEYFQYIERCNKIIEKLQGKEQGISMKTIDQLLYAMDKAAGMRVKY